MKEGKKMKLKRIIILTILTLIFCTTCALAAEPQMTIDGEQTAKPNETKELSIKISSEIEIGVVSGKIESNEKISTIDVTGKNNWNLTFNKETGVFNIYKAEGAKEEEIISIKYTTAGTEGTGKITLSNLKMTTIDYETKDVSNVVKEISIKKETTEPDPVEVTLKNIKITKAPKKTEYTEGEKFDKTGMVVTAEYSDGTSKEIKNYTYTPSGELNTTHKKITISYTENQITKTVEQDIVVKKVVVEDKEENKEDDNKEEPKDEQTVPGTTVVVPNDKKDETTAEKDIPKAGAKTVVSFIVIAISIAIIMYRKNKKYEDIN